MPNHMVRLCLVLQETTKLSSRVAIPFYQLVLVPARLSLGQVIFLGSASETRRIFQGCCPRSSSCHFPLLARAKPSEQKTSSSLPLFF